MPELQAALQQDGVAAALLTAIEELEKRPKEDPVRQLAVEVDDVLRRYVAETAIPARPQT
jgi:hypothetical protein